MDRRRFLYSAGMVAAVSSVPELGWAQENDPIEIAVKRRLSILQGLTTETTTQLTVDIERDVSVVYTLKDVQTGRVVQPYSVVPFSYNEGSDWRVDKVKFDSLELGHKYEFTVTSTKKKKKVLDQRYLKTVDLNKPNARIGLMSCMNNLLGEKTDIWKSAEKADVDYLFFIGDNVYGDLLIFSGPKLLWKRYLDSRETIPFYRWKNLKPVIAVWDDHDFGRNDADGNLEYKDTSLKLFNAFFAQDPIPGVLEKGPGVSSYFRAFNQNFLFFDDRYFRGLPNPSTDYGFLGHDQIAHFNAKQASSTLPTWVIQGAPMFGRHAKGSSYEATSPDELEHFLSTLRGWNAPIIFGGGDLHFSELSVLDPKYLGYKSYEVISSCMHSTLKKKHYDNPNERIGGYLKENFCVVQNTSVNDAVWKITCIAAKQKVPFDTVAEVG